MLAETRFASVDIDIKGGREIFRQYLTWRDVLARKELVRLSLLSCCLRL